MPFSPAVLLLDDGELDLVLEVLEGMDVPFLHLQGHQIRRTLPRPRSLLLTTARRAIRMPQLAEMVRGADTPVWIAFSNQDFLPFRERLASLGVHFLVQTSVSADVLRLFVEHVMYRGTEKRDDLRLPAGSGVSCEIEGLIRPATLLEFSVHGCRLRLQGRPKPRTPITVNLPAHLGGGRVLSIPGQTLRVIEGQEQQEVGENVVAVEFDELTPEASRRLAKIFKGKSIGTLVTRLWRKAPRDVPSDASTPSPAQPRRVPPARPAPRRERRVDLGAHESERRHGRRAAYHHGITARVASGTHVLLGRDLSVEGIRVGAHPALTLGADVRVALYGGPPRRPLILAATVVRQDSEEGVVLRFGHVGPEALDALERILDALPSVESLCSDGGEPTPLVVSRIVADDTEGV